MGQNQRKQIQTAGGRGGSIFAKGGTGSNPSISIEDSNFTRNQAVTGAGGAAYLEAFVRGVTVKSTRFNKNLAGTSGGTIEMIAVEGAVLEQVDVVDSVAVRLLFKHDWERRGGVDREIGI